MYSKAEVMQQKGQVRKSNTAGRELIKIKWKGIKIGILSVSQIFEPVSILITVYLYKNLLTKHQSENE